MTFFLAFLSFAFLSACGRIGFDETSLARATGPFTNPTVEPEDPNVITPPAVSVCTQLDQCSTTIGTQSGGFQLGTQSSLGLRKSVNGALILGGFFSDSPFRWFGWVSEADKGTVSKIDLTSGQIIAEYPSVRPGGGWPLWNVNDCILETAGNQANCPMNTAVDQRGDAYVVNLAPEQQSTVTKIASETSRCVDRNANGTIETSATNDQVLPDDECVIWTTAVGPPNGAMAAISIGQPSGVDVGDVWIGFRNHTEICRLNANTGTLVGCISTMGIDFGNGPWNYTPVAAGTAPNGNIWFIQPADTGSTYRVLGVVNPETMTFTAVENPFRNGANQLPVVGANHAIDAKGRIWILGTDGIVTRYDPSAVSGSRSSDVTLGAGTVQRLVVTETDTWVTESHTLPAWTGLPSNKLYRLPIDSEPLSFSTVTLESTAFWNTPSVNLDGTLMITRANPDELYRFDWANPTTAHWNIPLHYSASVQDITGYQLNRLASNEGSTRYVITGCQNARWTRVEYDADIPAGTSIEFRARTATSTDTLPSASWVGAFPITTSPIDLALAPGPLSEGQSLEIEIRLKRQPGLQVSPELRNLIVRSSCENSGN